MIKRLLPLILLAILLPLFVFGAERSQTGFDAFWQKFKIAVKNKQKNEVAELTSFPLAMPYGVTSIKTKSAFIGKYQQVFSGEADAVTCFEKAKPQKENAKKYTVACKIKGTEKTTDADEPIIYNFELTKTGWRFVGLDNINE